MQHCCEFRAVYHRGNFFSDFLFCSLPVGKKYTYKLCILHLKTFEILDGDFANVVGDFQRDEEFCSLFFTIEIILLEAFISAHMKPIAFHNAIVLSQLNFQSRFQYLYVVNSNRHEMVEPAPDRIPILFLRNMRAQAHSSICNFRFPVVL